MKKNDELIDRVDLALFIVLIYWPMVLLAVFVGDLERYWLGLPLLLLWLI